MWTVAELLEWTQRRFTEVGIASPRVDAEHLLAHAMNCSRISLYVRHSEVVAEESKRAFRELVRRRLRREPVAYIEGKRGFHALDLELEVDRHVLIPRPETEHLVDWLLEELPASEAASTLLDVGTGSGAIALAVARARRTARVLASDSSPDALRVAETNAKRLGLEVQWVLSDLLETIEVPPFGFTAIAANLPYIPTSEIDSLDPDVRDHEPRAALDGGPDGLRLIERLVVEVVRSNALAPGRALYLEIGHGQLEAVSDMLRQHAFEDVEARRDYSGMARVVRGRRKHSTAPIG